jgi:hypothetical protein
VFRAWELSPGGYATLPMRGPTTRMFAIFFMFEFVPSSKPRVNGLIAGISVSKTRNQGFPQLPINLAVRW